MRYLVILVLLTALGGCVTPKPSPESFVDAEQRIEAAVAAGAETHAPVELKFAREKLAEARYGMERKSFEKALYLVEQSEINAELGADDPVDGRQLESPARCTAVLGQCLDDARAGK